jgi:LysR family glycine cleavage system transcriptional activator
VRHSDGNWPGMDVARLSAGISGRLVRPFDEELRLSKTYWIICPKATTTLPKIVMFRDWLLSEAASDIGKLRKLPTKGRTPARLKN